MQFAQRNFLGVLAPKAGTPKAHYKWCFRRQYYSAINTL